ncbi:MAG: hypothetical protein ABII20_02855 [Candidatus Omnitrophota bacterium]|nr:hypothetical protein [bacterium]MBU3929830.1 hypothetical protein [bacterium]MDO9514438.1 hypothetical protein [Elusimicrobiota bacterium]
MTKMTRSNFMRAWTYFRRGHSVYLVFGISFLNFTVIQWRLLVEKVDALKFIFQRFTYFFVAFFAVYIPLAVLIGYIDYRRGSVPVDSVEAARANPWVKDLSKALMLMSKGDEDVRKIMSKWSD